MSDKDKDKKGSFGAGADKLRGAVEKAKEEAQKRQQQQKLDELRKKQAARGKQPIAPPRRPSPPARPAAAPAVAATAAAASALSDDQKSKLNSLRSSFDSVNQDAELGDLYREIGEIDNQLTNLPLTLDTLRGRGFVHSGNLEKALDKLDEEWDKVRPQVEARVQEEVGRLNTEVDALERQYNQLVQRPTAVLLTQVDQAIDRTEKRVSQVSTNLQNLYKGVKEGLNETQGAIERAEWMIQQIDESPAIELYPAEGPLLAVEATWEKDGDGDPSGILYLTDQRILFEQKEEIATKKFLFITTASEKVQKLLLEAPAREVEDIKHSEEGRGFLGLRSDDILELVFSSNTNFSRARFHIKGQDSSEWAAMLKHVRSGEIDRYRHTAYLEAMESAASATASLPTQCPSCFAELAAQPRGVTSVTCEFCGAVVTAA